MFADVLQLSCLTQNAPAMGCSLLDIGCQCASENATAILQPCLKTNCTYEQTFSESKNHRSNKFTDHFGVLLHAQANLCNKPHDTRSRHIEITAYATGVIPVIALGLRILSRYMGGSKLWWDDWLHLASVVREPV
jgi:hypothetical protein